MTEPNATGLSQAQAWSGTLLDGMVALGLLGLAAALLWLGHRRRSTGNDAPGESPAASSSQRVTAWAGALLVIFLVTLALVHLVQAWTALPAWTSLVLKGVAAFAGLAAAVGLWCAAPALAALPTRAQLDATRDALAAAHREIDIFTASVSHDLRAPLTSIAGQVGMLELTLGERLDDEPRQRLRKLQAGVTQMAELIDALVKLSRTTRLPLTPEPLDLSGIAEEIVADLRRRHPERQVGVTIQPGLRARGDRKLLTDAFAALLDNAWKFTAPCPGAHIEVGRGLGGTGVFHVRDNGVGFDMAYSDKLFKPFKRLHGAEFAGPGVGLALASRIVTRHGGRIWADARENAGAVFYVQLPP